MPTPPRDKEPESSNAIRQAQSASMFADEDAEDLQSLQPVINATKMDNQEMDLIEQTIQETLEDTQNLEEIAAKTTKDLAEPWDDEPSELFVSSDQDEPLVSALHHGNCKINKQQNSEDECMEINAAEASPTAQAAWAKPRPRKAIDFTVVQQEPKIKEEPKDDVACTGIGSTAAFPSIHRKVTPVESENLERRKLDLASKLMNGSLNQDEFAELTQINQQLQTAVNVTHEGFPSQSANKRSTKKRKGPVLTAAEHFAREQEQEEEAERKRLAKELKRNSSGNSSRSTKRRRMNAKESRQLEQGAKQLQSMRENQDAIQERADRGDLPDEPVIETTKKGDQLKQMAAAVPELADKGLVRDQKRELKKATRAWGNGNCLARNGKWKVKGMRSLMPNHQIVVGAWMMGRELKKTKDLPSGGVLADVMGMGKTVETLSCMVGNQPSNKIKEAGEGATLIVCQSGHMIKQWMAEIKKHCEDKKFTSSVFHYKAGDMIDINLLASFNIVLASYHQVRDSMPSAKVKELMLSKIQDPEKYLLWLEQHTGDLFRIKWFRVVLDEAQQIKNYKTHTASSCSELNARYRWAVTGTPLINDADEFFSYLKFLKFNIGDIGDYLRTYTGGPDAQKRHQQLVFDIMYRRTHHDEFLGQRILNLPNTHPTHQYVELSKEETVIYRMMERCFRRKINREMKDGIAERQIMCYLVMLLRLRQAATHPFLLEGMMGEYFTFEDIRTTKARLQALKGKNTIYEQIGSWKQRHNMSNERVLAVIAEAERRQDEGATESRLEGVLINECKDYDGDLGGKDEASSSKNTPRGSITIVSDTNDKNNDDRDEVDSVDDVEEDADGMVPEEHLSSSKTPDSDSGTASFEQTKDEYLNPFGQSTFGLHFDMDKQLDYLERLEKLEIAKCGLCKKKPNDPVQGKGKCEHIFCLQCIVTHFASTGRKCPVKGCRKIVGVPKRLQGFEDDDTEDDSNSTGHSPRSSKGHKEKEYLKGFDYIGFQPYEDDRKDKKPIRFLQVGDKKTNVPITPSAKTTALKETILKWQAEAPDDKIIIFSQFNVCMKVVARMLEAEGIEFSYLSGAMNTDLRTKAVKEFEEGDKVKVLIASLRAGGTALNLTRGNRVVLMELWWNHAVEQQAFARVYRIGQRKETHFLRFVVNTPIEKRMLSMQFDKILAIDAALQDNGPRAPKISLEDIASLLGKVVTDKDGDMQVVADYSDSEDDYDDACDSRTIAAAAIEEEEDLPGFVVSDGEVEYESDEE